MRRLFGILAFVLSGAALCIYATVRTAPAIEARIAERVAGVDLDPAVQISVSGRDVTVSGEVPDEAARAEVLARLSALHGVRRVDGSLLDVLPIATPFEIVFVKEAGALVGVYGFAPSDAQRAELQAKAGAATVDLSVAAGVPDAAWWGAADQALLALDGLRSARAVLSDRHLTLTGMARGPADRDQVLAALGTLSEGYSFEADITTQDDGRPVRLLARLSNGVVALSGKLPEDLTPTELTTLVEQAGLEAEAVDLDQGVIEAPVAAWSEAAQALVEALSQLAEGELSIEGDAMRLTGTGDEAGLAAAQALVPQAPDGFTISTELTPADAGVAFALTAQWDGALMRADGDYPADFTPDWPGEIEDSGRRLSRSDEAERFSGAAQAGLAALTLLEAGELQALETEVTLTGQARDHRVGEAVTAALAEVPDGVTVQTELGYLEQDIPAAWRLNYAAASGASVEGYLPQGITPEHLADILGLPRIEGNAESATQEPEQPVAELLAPLVPYLSQTERFELRVDESGAGLDMVLSQSADLDQIAAELAQSLPPDLSFSLAPSSEVPEQGARRVNAATGRSEVYAAGYWLPELEFEPDSARCAAETQVVLIETPVRFLSGSAQLDQFAALGLNQLAAVAQVCVAAGFTLEVAGHTDASGDPDDNLVLSQQRAEAVRQGLLARGLPGAAIEAYGFGASQPIADNATEQGRAMNRRTDFNWFAPGDLRDP